MTKRAGIPIVTVVLIVLTTVVLWLRDPTGRYSKIATLRTSFKCRIYAFGYTGRDRDSESGFQYNRHRYYDAVVGRWISEDPLVFAAGDTNLNRYVSNEPLILVALTKPVFFKAREVSL